jgi:hypothetical protein
MKRNPWLESEIKILKNNLHLHIVDMIRTKILPERTYWEIYNWLSANGYVYDFSGKKWIKEMIKCNTYVKNAEI